MFDTETILTKTKKIAAGLGIGYGSIALLVIALGVLNVLNSVPFASLGLELAGLYYLFLNRSSILPTLEKVKNVFSKEDLESISKLIPGPKPTEGDKENLSQV